MRGLLFDAKKNDFTEVDVKDLHDYYKLINCSCIDVCRRKIGDRYFEIVVDDEGLLKDKPMLSAINPLDDNCVLVGNLIFYDGVDYEGEFTPITDEGVKIIKENLLTAYFDDGSRRNLIKIEW